VRRAARLLLYLCTAAVVLALGKVHARYIGGYDYTGSLRFVWSFAYIGLLCLAAYGVGLPDLARTGKVAVGSAVVAIGAAALGISAMQLLVGSAELPRFVVFGAALVLVPIYLALSVVSAGGRARAEGRDRVVLVGAADEAASLHDDLAGHPERSATLSATLPPETARSLDARVKPLVEAVVRVGASVVVLDREAQADESIVAQAATLHEHGLRIRTLTLFYDEWLGKLPLAELERVSLMFDIGEIHQARYSRVKRIVDVAVGVLGLVALVLVTPVVLVGNLIANRGSLLYRQTRVGRNGRLFDMVKFRTMRAGGEGSDWTDEHDPRVTPFGRWLRRTHLDELAQVLNILRGDLSIVGPRPEQPRYVEELMQKIPFYDLRHRVRPGLTGWAQVKYAYGGSDSDAMEKLQYEFFYLRHQSLSLDLRILGRTVRSVIGQGGR
jgi:lipopolysaccharide/colanic/teichoic acid biosynthesis glycosyltransferase